MKTFKEGDRVSHPTQGEGTVTSPHPGTGWTTVTFHTSEGLVAMMTDDHLLTPVPTAPIARFKEGDRVHHSFHGSATVKAVSTSKTLVEIIPDVSGRAWMVHPISLTHEPKPRKFKIGDRVSHPMHGIGTVEEYDEYSGLYLVNIGGNRAYRALEHQIEPAKPEPKFTVAVAFSPSGGFTTGGTVTTIMNRKHAEAYLTELPDWDNVESITINRVKG